MVSFKKENLNNIKAIVQNKTGVQLSRVESAARARLPIIGRFSVAAVGVLFLAMFSAFAYQKFNAIKGDELALNAVYLGEGKFDIVIKNMSDKKLALEDNVKLEQWSTSKAVEGDQGKIKIENRIIPAGETGVVKIDISEGYDIVKMENELTDGDWYYFVLTNNTFAFGQDWMCSFNMDVSQIETPEISLTDTETEDPIEETTEETITEPISEPLKLIYPDWVLPTKELIVTTYFGKTITPIGTIINSNKINIGGAEGDSIYAVSDGTIKNVGYDEDLGIVLVLSVKDGTEITYGHLKSTNVKEGDTVNKGDVIALMGDTGMATGPNLAFAVSVNGEYVNPLAE